MRKAELAFLSALLFGIMGVSFASTGIKLSEDPLGQDSCPAGREDARDAVVSFLTDPSWADERREIGATGFSSDDIRRLRDPDDANVCTRLEEKSPSSNTDEIARVYYRAGSYFFIIRVPREDPSPEDLNMYGVSIEPFEGDSLEPKTTYLY